jgi:hypothetical protein
MTHFGSNLVAMVTPMLSDGALSDPGLANLVDHLLATECDGIVVGGTTGESPTLTETESAWLVNTVSRRVAGRARVIAGIGTYDTAASVRRARAAEAAGADALLLVCPYYSRPTQAGVVAHCVAVADATALPVMLYDVPARTGIAMSRATLVELAGRPRIFAVKDAKGDLAEAQAVMAETSLAYYCGIDDLNRWPGQRRRQRCRNPHRGPHPRGPRRRPVLGTGYPGGAAPARLVDHGDVARSRDGQGGAGPVGRHSGRDGSAAAAPGRARGSCLVDLRFGRAGRAGLTRPRRVSGVSGRCQGGRRLLSA